MKQFILASHGRFAEGIYDSLCMIMGKQSNISIISAYVDPQVDLKEQIKIILDRLDSNDEVIVITDIFGGSINNEFMNLIEERDIHLVCGLNLPLLIELLSSQNGEIETAQWLSQTISLSKETIQYCNQNLIFSEADGDEF